MSPVRGFLRGPFVDKEGYLTAEAARYLSQELMPKTDNSLDRQGQITAPTKIAGRSEGVGTTVQNLTAAGEFNSLDKVHEGTTYGKPLQTALNSGKVDLSKPGVIGPLGSPKINQNVMSNYSNNATVDSIDNGVNATIRVYGPGGPGTSWHQFVGGVIGPEIPAFSGAYAYSTDYNVFYNGTSYGVSVNGFDTLPDGILFSGGLHTVAAGGGGGLPGGGGSGGGGGGFKKL